MCRKTERIKSTRGTAIDPRSAARTPAANRWGLVRQLVGAKVHSRYSSFIWVKFTRVHILSKTGHFLVKFEALLRPLLNWYHENRHLPLNRFLGESKDLPSDLVLVICMAPLGGQWPRLVLKIYSVV